MYLYIYLYLLLPLGEPQPNKSHLYFEGEPGFEDDLTEGPTEEVLEQRIDEGEITGMLLMCSNPIVSNPNAHFVKEALKKLEKYYQKTNISTYTIATGIEYF